MPLRRAWEGEHAEVVINSVSCDGHMILHLLTTFLNAEWKMASKITLQCICCQKEIAPGNRLYLKSRQEPLESVKEVLMTVPGRSEERMDCSRSQKIKIAYDR